MRLTPWFILVGGTLLVAPVFAEMRVRLFDGYGSGSGGEFDVRFTSFDVPNFQFSSAIGTKTWNSQTTRMSTFCVERDEFIGFNTEYRATIDEIAIGGGNNTNAGDALDPWTAYLYTQFATGQLVNYDYLPSFGAANLVREADGGALQQVIWFLENETRVSSTYGGPTGYGYDPHSRTVAQAYLSGQALAWWDLAAGANWTTIRNVRVLNLTGLDGSEKQSQLILIPLPGAALLGVFGLCIAGWRKRL